MKKVYSLLFVIVALVWTGCDSVNEPIAQQQDQGASFTSESAAKRSDKRGGNSRGNNQCDDDHDGDHHDNDHDGDDDDCDGDHNGNHDNDCDGDHDNDHDGDDCDNNGGGSSCDADGIVTLWAGKTYNAGTVTVTEDNANLYVKYATVGSWKIKETHLDISTSAYVQRGAPGQYDYHSSNGAGVTTYTYTIPKTWAAGTKLYFLAHAVVGKYSGNYCSSTQTAYGGTVVSPRNGSWYATFCHSLETTPPPVTYSISGATFNDANSNGTQDVGEAGLANITVSLSNGATAVSNANGIYTFPGLSAGSYTVSAPSVSGYTQTTSSSAAVTVTNANVSVSFGYALIPTVFYISGIIYNDTNLNGTQDVGEPGIASATVKLNGTITATTDANGNYAFNGLSAGMYTVTPNAILDLNLTTPGTVTLVISSANGTAHFGFAQYSIPDRTVEQVKAY
jgi:hypothetical protein